MIKYLSSNLSLIKSANTLHVKARGNSLKLLNLLMQIIDVVKIITEKMVFFLFGRTLGEKTSLTHETMAEKEHDLGRFHEWFHNLKKKENMV